MLVVADVSVLRVFCFFVLLLLIPSSAANSPPSTGRRQEEHGGNTHPAQRSPTSGPTGPGPGPRAPSPAEEETKGEGAGDPGRERSHRPSDAAMAPVGRRHRHPAVHTDTENLVSSLKDQLKESQAAQVHTRSIINILQEKIEAQETDLSIMKNEISQLRREQTTHRDVIASLQSSASDARWAIASVKRGQEQTTGDVTALKRVQERHNETLFLVEEVMMTGALEVQNQEKRWNAVQQDLHRMTVQANEDRGKVQRLHRAVDRLTKGRGAENENENRIDDNDSSLTNHLSVYNPQASGVRIDPIHGKNTLTAATGSTTEGGAKSGAKGVAEGLPPPSIFTKLAAHDAALELTKGLLGNLSDHMTSVEAQLSLMSERLMLDSQLLQFQQSFVNFTSQVYQLQRWRKTQTEQGRYTDEYQSQHENDMASVIFHLESQSERLRALEQLVTDEHRTKDLESLNATVVRLKQSVSRILSGPDKSAERERERQVQGRLKAAEEGLRRTDGRLRDVELTLLNASLVQCRAVNEQLVGDDVRGGSYVRQMADVQMKISEQTTAFARIDRGLAGIFQELDKNAATASTLSQQLEELKKLSPDVTALQRELLNFVLQLPTDCYDVPSSTGKPLHDGVYLIRPGTSHHSARTFCLVDPSDGPQSSPWTLIQRRRDGRESFSRSWTDYRTGFGDPGGEFWLGNEAIHRLTSDLRPYRLRVDLWDVLGRYWTADYAAFRVQSESALYRLELGEFTGGNATDALRYSNLMPFSAVDRDNDVSTTHCAQFYQSGWWYKHCHYSNLNGRYTSGVVWFHQGLNDWIQLRQTTMRISMVTG